jgi:r-opsin
MSPYPILMTNYSDHNIFPMAFRGDPEIKLLGWNMPPEDMHLVLPHWQKFEAPKFYMHLMLALVYFVLMICSFMGNGIVIWIFSSTKSLRSASNMFIVNLAIFDFLMMLEMPLLLLNSYHQRIVGGDTACTIYAVLGSLSGIGGAASNAAIAFDRYKTISSPMDGRLSRTQSALIILFTWFYSMPFTIFPALKIWGRFVPEGFLTTCSFDYLSENDDTRVFTICIFVYAYCIPMALITFFYSRLLKHVQEHENMLKEQAKRMNIQSLAANKDPNTQSVEIRIAKAAFTIFFLFVCAWTPYAIVALTGTLGNKNILNPLVTMIPAVCSKIVSCLDPWVYAISHPRYRAVLEKRVPWLGIKETLNEVKPEADTKSMGSTTTTTATTT